MVLLQDDRIEILTVNIDAPAFLGVDTYHCPLCGMIRAPDELHVATVQVAGHGEPFEVVLCRDCVAHRGATPQDVITS